jgi:hypothetical protein
MQVLFCRRVCFQYLFVFPHAAELLFCGVFLSQRQKENKMEAVMKTRVFDKLKTNAEVIAAIKRGYEGCKWDQYDVYHEGTQSEKHPCGTQFCLLGALSTDFGLTPDTMGTIAQTVQWLLDDRIAWSWTKAFYNTTEDGLLEDLAEMLTAEEYGDLKNFLIQRRAD